jgi:8-oxo-dGTP pyrophosphatase MutT (NUDIX family)
MKKICGNGAFGIIWRILREKDYAQIQVLLQKGPDRNFWELTGGGLEYNTHGEYPEDEGHIFEGALAREAKEELGVELDASKLKFEAVFQQLKPIDADVCTTGCVVLYSHFLSEQEVYNLTIIPQESEVSDTRWWDVVDAISTSEGTGVVDYVGLSFRRMLAVFYKRHMHLLKKHASHGYVTPPHIWQGNLGQSLTLNIGEDLQITV